MECMAPLLRPGHLAEEIKTCLHWKVCAWMLTEARSGRPRKWKQMSLKWGIGNKYVLSVQWDIFQQWRDPNYRQTLWHRGTPKQEAKWEQRLRNCPLHDSISTKRSEQANLCGRKVALDWGVGMGPTAAERHKGVYRRADENVLSDSDTTLQSHQKSFHWTLRMSEFSGIWIRSEQSCESKLKLRNMFNVIALEKKTKQRTTKQE